MSVYYKVYSDAADRTASVSLTTYAASRASTLATGALAGTVRIGQNAPNTSQWGITQYFAQFDLSALPSIGTTYLNLTFSTLAATGADVIEVRQASTSANKIDGAALAAVTPLLGSFPATVAATLEVPTKFKLTGTPTQSAASLLLLHSQKERTNTAPTTAANEAPTIYLADFTGTTKDPYLEVAAPSTQVFLDTPGTAVQSYTIPSDWSDTLATVEAVGRGGPGGAGTTGTSGNGGGGGAGGMYAKRTAPGLTPGAVVYYQLPGSAQTFDTFFNDRNLLAQTDNNLAAGFWNKVNVTTTDSQSDPVSTSKAGLVTETTAVVQHAITQTVSKPLGVARTYRLSATVKSSTRNIGVGVYTTTGITLAYAGFDLQGSDGGVGTVIGTSTQDAARVTIASPAITDLGSGWYRVSTTINILFTNDATFECQFTLLKPGSGMVMDYTGDTAANVTIYGMTLGYGTTDRGFVPTTTEALYTVYARAGNPGSGITGGTAPTTGGQGDIVFAGGAGGGTSTTRGGGGGGGAGGPAGVGKTGGASSSATSGGGGGGGSNGALATLGGSSTTGTGGAGGAGVLGTGGGTGGATNLGGAATADTGGGGGGGFRSAVASANSTGGAGADTTYWDATHGLGGGGGGGGGNSVNTAGPTVNGGAGGGYGSGGGGSGYTRSTSSTRSAGAGGPGIVVLNYVAAAAGPSGTLAVTLDALTAAGTGAVTTPERLATLDVTLGAMTTLGTGRVTVGGTASLTLAELTGTLTGKVTVGGTAAGTLLPLTLVGTGTVVDMPPATGTLAVTLDALSSTATGRVMVQGQLVMSGAAPTVPSSTLRLTYTPPSLRNDFDGDVGFKFTVSTNQDINWLGLYVATGNTGTHTVRLYNHDTQTLLATASIDMTGKTAGSYAWTAITPFTLATSTTYALIKQVAIAAGQQWGEVGNTTFASPVTGIWSVFRPSSTGAFTSYTSGQQYVGLDMGSGPTTGTGGFADLTLFGQGSVASAISTGTLSVTLDAATLSASGAVANQIFSGTLATTLGALTGTLTGKVTVGGTAAGTLLPVTLVGTGTAQNQVFTGTLAATLAPLTALGVGNVANQVFSGTLAATLAPVTLFATGTGLTVSTGTLGVTLDALTAQGTGSVFNQVFSGTLASTLGALTGTLTGKVTVGGTAAGTLLPLVLVGTGTGLTVTNGTLATTLDPVALGAVGTVANQVFTGTLAATLAPLTLAGTARTMVRGTLATTLGALTGTLSGKVTVGGTAAGTLLPLVLVGTGTAVNQTFSGTLSATLGPATLLGIGNVYTPTAGTAFGTLNVTLGAMTLFGKSAFYTEERITEDNIVRITEDGVVRIIEGRAPQPGDGFLEATLAPLTLVGTGTAVNQVFTGTLAATLAPLTLVGTGRVIVRGTLGVTLGAMTSTMSGRVTVGGTAAGTLLPLMLVGTGTVKNQVFSGTLSATLGPMTLSGAGKVNWDGNFEVWNGSAWVVGPLKVWSGSAWVRKFVKHWNGSEWVL